MTPKQDQDAVVPTPYEHKAGKPCFPLLRGPGSSELHAQMARSALIQTYRVLASGREYSIYHPHAEFAILPSEALVEPPSGKKSVPPKMVQVTYRLPDLRQNRASGGPGMAQKRVYMLSPGVRLEELTELRAIFDTYNPATAGAEEAKESQVSAPVNQSLPPRPALIERGERVKTNVNWCSATVAAIYARLSFVVLLTGSDRYTNLNRWQVILRLAWQQINLLEVLDLLITTHPSKYHQVLVEFLINRFDQTAVQRTLVEQLATDALIRLKKLYIMAPTGAIIKKALGAEALAVQFQSDDLSWSDRLL